MTDHGVQLVRPAGGSRCNRPAVRAARGEAARHVLRRPGMTVATGPPACEAAEAWLISGNAVAPDGAADG